LKRTWRLILTGALVLLIGLVGMLPVSAAPTYINIADTYATSGNLTAHYLDGSSHPAVKVSTLIIGTNTAASFGVIGTASLIVNGSTVDLDGFVGSGTHPYLSLAGKDSAGTFITVSGRVITKSGLVTSISGKIDGFITSDGQNGAGWGGGGTGVFSIVKANSGTYSALLDATAALQYVEFLNPRTTLKLRDLTALAAGRLSFYYYLSATPGPQIGLRFTSPNGVGHVDVTVMTQSAASTGAWTKLDLTSASTRCVFYGNDDVDATGFAWAEDATVLTLGECPALIYAKNTATTVNVGGKNHASWELTDVLIDLYEVSARTCYIDDVLISPHTYTLEPVTCTGNFRATQ
jgi:hypothetical protein